MALDPRIRHHSASEWTDPRVLISPHTAALNSADNATRYLDRRPLRDRVDTVEFY